MAEHPRVEVIAVGASAGGVEALTALASNLPPDLPAAVLVVLHTAPLGGSVLPQILSRAGPLRARAAQEGLPIEPGTIIVAPGDYHLRVQDRVVRLDKGPRENNHRPAVDALFRSVAERFGPTAAGVILSGTRDDGAAGLAAIKRAGGWALVQDPDTALYGAMPANALARTAVDACLAVPELAACLGQLASAGHLADADPAAGEDAHPPQPQATSAPPGASVQLACPECGGVMTDLEEPDGVRFICHIGHSYTLQSLLDPQFGKVEEALWTAVRSLEERGALLRRMASLGGQELSAESIKRQAADCQEQADVVRDAVMSIRPIREAFAS